MTSLGVIKVPDALPEQIGMISFFYPTSAKLESGAYTSIYPDPINPLLTVNVYTGDLGLDSGVPRNVYALDVTGMELVAGRDASNPAIELSVGESVQLPDGIGSVRFDGLLRYASLDIAFNPGGIWVLIFSLVALIAIVISLSITRRRIWVRVGYGRIEYAALARGDDDQLEQILREMKEEIEGLDK
jgi:cytochrome c biogenesis protein